MPKLSEPKNGASAAAGTVLLILGAAQFLMVLDTSVMNGSITQVADYACGSLITALSKNLPVLLFGWARLAGMGSALILSAIVALVAGNIPVAGQTRAYRLIAACGAIAVAVVPLFGDFCAAFFYWRYVFAGEVVIAMIILVLRNQQLSGGQSMFFFQIFKQGGYFFVVPRFLSVVPERNAQQTGVRLVPLSV